MSRQTLHAVSEVTSKNSFLYLICQRYAWNIQARWKGFQGLQRCPSSSDNTAANCRDASATASTGISWRSEEASLRLCCSRCLETVFYSRTALTGIGGVKGCFLDKGRWGCLPAIPFSNYHLPYRYQLRPWIRQTKSICLALTCKVIRVDERQCCHSSMSIVDRNTLQRKSSQSCSQPHLVWLLDNILTMVGLHSHSVDHVFDFHHYYTVANVPKGLYIHRIKSITLHHHAWIDSLVTTYELSDGSTMICSNGRKGAIFSCSCQDRKQLIQLIGARSSTYDLESHEVVLGIGGLLGFIKVTYKCLGLVQFVTIGNAKDFPASEYRGDCG